MASGYGRTRYQPQTNQNQTGGAMSSNNQHGVQQNKTSALDQALSQANGQGQQNGNGAVPKNQRRRNRHRPSQGHNPNRQNGRGNGPTDDDTGDNSDHANGNPSRNGSNNSGRGGGQNNRNNGPRNSTGTNQGHSKPPQKGGSYGGNQRTAPNGRSNFNGTGASQPRQSNGQASGGGGSYKMPPSAQPAQGGGNKRPTNQRPWIKSELETASNEVVARVRTRNPAFINREPHSPAVTKDIRNACRSFAKVILVDIGRNKNYSPDEHVQIAGDALYNAIAGLEITGWSNGFCGTLEIQQAQTKRKIRRAIQRGSVNNLRFAVNRLTSLSNSELARSFAQFVLNLREELKSVKKDKKPMGQIMRYITSNLSSAWIQNRSDVVRMFLQAILMFQDTDFLLTLDMQAFDTVGIAYTKRRSRAEEVLRDYVDKNETTKNFSLNRAMLNFANEFVENQKGNLLDLQDYFVADNASKEEWTFRLLSHATPVLGIRDGKAYMILLRRDINTRTIQMMDDEKRADLFIDGHACTFICSVNLTELKDLKENVRVCINVNDLFAYVQYGPIRTAINVLKLAMSEFGIQLRLNNQTDLAPHLTNVTKFQAFRWTKNGTSEVRRCENRISNMFARAFRHLLIQAVGFQFNETGLQTVAMDYFTDVPCIADILGGQNQSLENVRVQLLINALDRKDGIPSFIPLSWFSFGFQDQVVLDEVLDFVRVLGNRVLRHVYRVVEKVQLQPTYVVSPHMVEFLATQTKESKSVKDPAENGYETTDEFANYMTDDEQEPRPARRKKFSKKKSDLSDVRKHDPNTDDELTGKSDAEHSDVDDFDQGDNYDAEFTEKRTAVLKDMMLRIKSKQIQYHLETKDDAWFDKIQEEILSVTSFFDAPSEFLSGIDLARFIMAFEAGEISLVGIVRAWRDTVLNMNITNVYVDAAGQLPHFPCLGLYKDVALGLRKYAESKNVANTTTLHRFIVSVHNVSTDAQLVGVVDKLLHKEPDQKTKLQIGHAAALPLYVAYLLYQTFRLELYEYQQQCAKAIVDTDLKIPTLEQIYAMLVHASTVYVLSLLPDAAGEYMQAIIAVKDGNLTLTLPLFGISGKTTHLAIPAFIAPMAGPDNVTVEAGRQLLIDTPAKDLLGEERANRANNAKERNLVCLGVYKNGTTPIVVNAMRNNSAIQLIDDPSKENGYRSYNFGSVAETENYQQYLDEEFVRSIRTA